MPTIGNAVLSSDGCEGDEPRGLSAGGGFGAALCPPRGERLGADCRRGVSRATGLRPLGFFRLANSMLYPRKPDKHIPLQQIPASRQIHLPGNYFPQWMYGAPNRERYGVGRDESNGATVVAPSCDRARRGEREYLR